MRTVRAADALGRMESGLVYCDAVEDGIKSRITRLCLLAIGGWCDGGSAACLGNKNKRTELDLAGGDRSKLREEIEDGGF